ncbi:sensor histidine kinase [Apilactobacillus ozensis DSM 23829 = JCM 17196]|uniref:histidine kinase n=1 Tax=Apilactobacillus ozensis DSM 23829 = JCM 17196 TaxID=1423781 RepID=A0A0R2AMV6_9LACO|nr:HAMP domain-containing sensor histidine kinase [Apilactobacillus ozensis]KRM68199.1 sensor histidine kinase [Apilactobacillus ozensis DSM 23829 = JCM 17196]
MKLTTREKMTLVGEGITTLFLLIIINLAVLVIMNDTIQDNPGIRNGIFIIKQSIAVGPMHLNLWSWANVFMFIFATFDVFVIYWRLLRRYHQMQTAHIIREVHYIAAGHFDHRINFELKGSQQKFVRSINALVDSVIASIEEERNLEKSKDEMIANVSHDIRTPLTSIIGYLSLLENKQYRSMDDILKYTHIAFVKSKQMKELADDLFEYTKVSHTTSTPFNNTIINVGEMLDQMAVNFEWETVNNKMNIVSSSKEDNVKMEADPEKLARAINNLIINAFKYGNDGQNIYLNCHNVSDKEITITVANDGKKIPKDSINKLFNRFYRVDSSRNTKTGGTGLGLAIVQSVVDLHNGYVDVTSTDELTSFVIHLPINHKDKLIDPNRLAKINSNN